MPFLIQAVSECNAVEYRNPAMNKQPISETSLLGLLPTKTGKTLGIRLPTTGGGERNAPGMQKPGQDWVE